MPPKQVYLIRHAQGYHNLSPSHHNIRDPLLTPAGEQHCRLLSTQISDIQSIDCIVASPSRRTLYTALVTFKPVLEAKADLKIIALPELQETSMMPCDVGASVDELRLEFEGKQVDLSHVYDGWNDKLEGPFSPETERVMSRCRKARRLLQRREEANVAVVSHGGLLHFLTEDWEDAMKGCGTGWSNCELRTYTFNMTTDSSITNAPIIETPISLIRRMHSAQPLSSDEQIQLAAVAQASWVANGYIIAGITDAKNATSDVEEIGDEQDNERAETDTVIDIDAIFVRKDKRGIEKMGVQGEIKANL